MAPSAYIHTVNGRQSQYCAKCHKSRRHLCERYDCKKDSSTPVACLECLRPLNQDWRTT